MGDRNGIQQLTKSHTSNPQRFVSGRPTEDLALPGKGWLVFNGTFSTKKLYRAIAV